MGLVPAALDDLTAELVVEELALVVPVLAEARVPLVLALELERTVELLVAGRAVLLLEDERVVPVLALELERVLPLPALELERTVLLLELERVPELTELLERVVLLVERVVLALLLERVLLLTVPPTDLEVVAERVVLPEERDTPEL